jgi:hypothetical protein
VQRRVADELERPLGPLTIVVQSAHVYAPGWALMAERVAAAR